jgi:tetratricopeptide (TPR) repeat protein
MRVFLAVVIGVLLLGLSPLLSWAGEDIEFAAEPSPTPVPTAKPTLTITPVSEPKVSATPSERVISLPKGAIEPSANGTESQAYDYNEPAPADVIKEWAPKIEVLTAAQLKKLGRAYGANKDHMLAIKALSLAVAKNRNDVEALTWLAHEQIVAGKDRDALANLKEALERNPRFEPAYLEMAALYEKKNNKYELRALYTDMIQQMGPKPHFLEVLCRLYTQGGFFEECKATCRQGIVADKANAKNYSNLAVCLRDTGHKDEARSLMKRSADNFPSSEEAQLLFAKFLEIDDKDYAGALRYYQEATRANPNSVKAWIGYANCNLELQKFSEAFGSYKKACSISRAAIGEVRHAISVLRLAKSNDWLPKFDVLAETCAMGLSK